MSRFALSQSLAYYIHHITLHYIILHCKCYITLHDITLHYIANVTLHYMKLHYIIYMHTRIHKCIRPSVGPTVRLYEQIECVRILPTKRALACRPWFWKLLS